MTQIPAFLSMLPGAGRYQLRKKGCTSRNAADFLPVFAPWRGSARASSVLLTPTGEAFRFDLFDKSSGVNAHHGIVVADTGSGKSVTLGALTLDARAAGVEAILIDNGRSWKPLTELLGGVHIPVDLSTSISPFLSYAQLAGAGTARSRTRRSSTSSSSSRCASPTAPGRRSTRWSATSSRGRSAGRYETRFRPHPEEPPLIGHFSEALAAHPWTHPQDKAIADDLVRRLAIYCTGIYAEFLNRPSQLRFDAPLLTFDLAKVSENAGTKAVAMATIIQAITNRAMARRTRTLVEVDEGARVPRRRRRDGAVPRRLLPEDAEVRHRDVDDLAEPERLPRLAGRAGGDRREQHDPHLPAPPRREAPGRSSSTSGSRRGRPRRSPGSR